MANVQIAKSSFNGGAVSPLLSARFGLEQYNSWCKTMRNFIALQSGPATRRPGFEYLGQAKAQTVGENVRVVPFVFSSKETRVLEFGPLYMRIWKDGALVMKEGSPYEVVTEYTSDDIPDLSFAQSADVVFIASENHAPIKISRYADDDWRLETLTFLPAALPPTEIKLSQREATGATGDREYEYVVTTVDDDTGEESLASVVAKMEKAKNISTLAYNQLTWTAPTTGNVLEYRIYRKHAGVFGFVGRAVGEAKFDDHVNLPDIEDSPPTGENPFDAAGKYPAIVSYWQQRIMWASSKEKPMTVWASVSAQFENMSRGVPPSPKDSIELTLATQQANRIMWLQGDRALCMGTTGDEWTVGKEGEALAHESGFSKQGGRGSYNTPAIFAGGNLIYVQRGGKTIRKFAYEFASDKYVAQDLTLLSSHLFEDSHIDALVFQQVDAPLVWCLMDDGNLKCSTLDVAQQINAWHEHETDGFVESICSVPHDDGDELFLVVRRTIGGVEKRYVERMSKMFLHSDNPAEATFYDSFKTVTGTDMAEVTGLEHLEGRDVLVWADGAESAPATVASGKISLPEGITASVVTVGLEIDTELAPVRPEASIENGATLGRKYKVSLAGLRLFRSMGGRVGKNSESMQDMLKHSASNMNVPAFASTDEKLPIDQGYSDEWNFLIKATGGAPLTVQSVVFSVEFSNS